MPLNGSPDAPLINFIQFRIIKDGEVKYRNAWVTDLVPTTDNIVQLVRAARARWKIENEAFNTLKNQGYHLKHNFGHGDRHLSEALFVVNLLAFFMHQIFELVDGLYQQPGRGRLSEKSPRFRPKVPRHRLPHPASAWAGGDRATCVRPSGPLPPIPYRRAVTDLSRPGRAHTRADPLPRAPAGFRISEIESRSGTPAIAGYSGIGD